MEAIQTYHRQNKIQREAVGIARLFKVDSNYRNKLISSGIGVYTPNRHKYKLCLASIIIAFSLVTPGTNIPGLFLVRKILK